jgi:hypothetical protein
MDATKIPARQLRIGDRVLVRGRGLLRVTDCVYLQADDVVSVVACDVTYTSTTFELSFAPDEIVRIYR